MLKPKEKKEIGIVFASVLVVVVVGLVLNVVESRKVSNVGMATTLISNLPDNPGVLAMLNEKCTPVKGNGMCDQICGQSRVCVPLEANCNANIEGNSCYCCEVPQ
jgi:hypothetical protein